MRGLSRNQAIDVIPEKEYLSLSEFAKSGSFVGKLDYKMWGRSMNLWCYFTLSTGEKVKLSCFRSQSGVGYTASKGGYDFSAESAIGNTFEITIGHTKAGRPIFLSSLHITS